MSDLPCSLHELKELLNSYGVLLYSNDRDVEDWGQRWLYHFDLVEREGAWKYARRSRYFVLWLQTALLMKRYRVVELMLKAAGVGDDDVGKDLSLRERIALYHLLAKSEN